MRFVYVSIEDKVLLLRHLTMLLEAGIPLRHALEIMRDQTVARSLKRILEIAIQDISDGHPFTKALERFPAVFDPFFVNMIRVGEASGTLPVSLGYLANQLQKNKHLQEQVRSALIYPALVFFGALGVGAYLAFFLFPQITPIFSSLRVELPWTTRALLASTAFVRQFWLALLAAVLVVTLSFVAAWKLSKRFRKIISQLLLITPLTSGLIHRFQVVQCARIFGTLLHSGIHIVPALQITEVSLTNIVYQELMAQVRTSIERGSTIENGLKHAGHLFSRTETGMIAVAEQTGRLPASLIALSEFTEHELESAIKNLTSLIEPLVLILVGALVGFIALSIILPIYQFTQGASRI